MTRMIGFFDLPVERGSGRGRHPVHFVDLGIPRPSVPPSPAPDPPFGRKSLLKIRPPASPSRINIVEKRRDSVYYNSIRFDAHGANYYYPGYMPGHHKDAHGKQGKSYRYPFTIHLGRERQLWIKCLVLRAYTLGGLKPPTL